MRECPRCNTQLKDGVDTCDKCGEQIETVASRGGKAKTDIAQRSVAALADVVKYYWPMLLAGVLFIVMQWRFPFVEWWRSWQKPHSYYSHGPLVPLIALFMVWANRKRLALVKIQPSWFGLLLIVPSIPFFVYGRWTGSGNVCALTFLAFLVGAVLMFTGTRMTRLLLFPMLYLLFMVPAPSSVLDSVSTPVQRMSTTLAAKVLHYTGQVFGDSDEGWGIRQAGNLIYSPKLPAGPDESEGVLRVEGECSGFRMLISLITFTAFFVYMLNAGWWKKALLVAISLPLSLFVNGLRIAVIGYVGIWTESAEAMQNFHNSWAMVFELVLSFAILFGLARLIKANDFGIPDPKTDPDAVARMSDTPRHKLVGRGFRGPMAIALFCLVIVSNFAIKPLETTAHGNLDRAKFAKTFGTWTSQAMPIDPLTRTELKTADMLSRGYFNTADDTESAGVFIQAARDTDAFHDPHSCIPGGGSSIDEDRVITLRFDKPKPFSVQATYLRSSNDQTGDSNLLVYWYNTESVSYPKTSQVRLVMRAAQVRDLQTIAKSWIGMGDRRQVEEDYAKRQTYCYRFQTQANYEDSNTSLARLERFIREFVANSGQFK
jgi:exosortase/archaeosortase family protein